MVYFSKLLGATLCIFFAGVLFTVEVEAQPVDSVSEKKSYQQSFDMEVPLPPTPTPVADSLRLVYELHLTNFAHDALVLSRVEALDAEDATVIAEMDDNALDRQLHRIGSSSADMGPRMIASGMRGVVYLELTLDAGRLPRVLEHRVTFHVVDRAEPQPVVVRGARIPVQTEPPVVLGPPLRGGPWAAVYNPFWERGHRRVIYAVEGRARIPGRFAIDWMKLDTDGRLARGEEDRVSNWYGYGADVLAVADGVVAATRDDVAESATLSGHPNLPLEDAAGNYIALNLGQGRYAFYEHLKPGSIRVELGERVQRGQVIASVGFTGHSTGPHLHFHVANANSPLGAEGLPFVLDGFTVLGSYNDFDRLGNAPWKPRGDALDPQRREEQPAPMVIVEFGKSESPK